jgi:hypothetical protein
MLMAEEGGVWMQAQLQGVSAAIAVIGGVVAIGRWRVERARRRKSEKVAEERRVQRARRAAAVRPTTRRSDGGWVFRGTSISPRR